MKGFNQQALATVCDKAQNTISQWETGVSEPSIEDFRKISKLTGFPISWFFQEEAALAPAAHTQKKPLVHSGPASYPSGGEDEAEVVNNDAGDACMKECMQQIVLLCAAQQAELVEIKKNMQEMSDTMADIVCLRIGEGSPSPARGQIGKRGPIKR